MKIQCINNSSDYAELEQVGKGLYLTVSEDSQGDRRKDESTIALSVDGAAKLYNALNEYLHTGKLSK